jgi:hypothetical protein
MSTLENPIPQFYSAPGNYPVTYTAVVDTFGFFLTEVIVNGVACTDGVFAGRPDLYLEIFDGSNTKIYETSNAPDDSPLPTSWQMNIPMNNPPYFMVVWDDDSPLCDDNCVTNSCNTTDGVNLTFPPASNFGTSTLVANNVGLIVQYKFNKPVIQVDGVDTVKVFPLPVVPVVSLNPDTLFSCYGDSIELSVPPIYSLHQWYEDTTLLAGFNQLSYKAGISGKYYVEVTNSFGCKDTSTIFNVNVNPILPFPTFFFTSTGDLQTNFTNFTIQWLFEGNPIPGASNSVYKPTQQGNHQLMIIDEFGCTRLSNEVFVFITSDGNVLANNHDVKIFPNPSNGIFGIEINNLNNERVLVKMTDLTGRIVYEENLNHQGNQITKKLDFRELSSGMYLIQINIDNQIINHRMIIK